MNPLSQVQLLQIARSITGFRRYTNIDLSEGNPPLEFSWLNPDDIVMGGVGFAFYFNTVEQARELRNTLQQGYYTNCLATSNGVPVTFVCLSDEIESRYL
ncbi:hypothetical protein [Leptothoe kymatousa]|uniref:Uncharacterized protein n=1 Tax=Leptothoe kymatousa TAU-MAC 1615 TaxID=2364775 RepID=A0ABS5XZ55_9CYAN|nr:hypothetical protein [Leptothoe kymatousa]MBT9310838.1 hypothetical protein [Leptothoe kymatousa TAU-MAC 1615]